MKTLKLNLVLLAVVAGAIGAFAFKPAHKTTAGVSYYWYTTMNGTGSSYVEQNTIGDEQTASGCQQTAVFCEAGFSSTQLVNPADPTQGVKSGQTESAEIDHN